MAGLEVHLAHGRRVARMHVASAPDGHWRVAAEIDGRLVVATTCSCWQRVEALRQRLARELQRTDDPGGCDWGPVAA